MVFSGRPSTACHACRPKRLKCDRVLPGCSQCRRKNIVCPGYRDATSLRLRDETDRVARMVEKTQNGGKSKTSPSPPRHTPPTELTHVPQTNAVLSLTPSVRDVAITYFMSSYIVSSPFEGYLAELYLSEPLLGDALSSAISATSLATFGMRFGSSKSVEIARRCYAYALAQTNTSLTDPKKAILDRTLAAVLLLGLYEAVVFRGGQSPTSWTAHTFGAMELLQLRGEQQFKTKLSQQLFAQASNNIRTSCIQRSVTIPLEFLSFTNKIRPLLDLKDPAISIAPIIDKIAHIRAQFSISPDPNLIHEAMETDREIIKFSTRLEEKFQYTFRSAENTPSWAYLNIAAQYPNLRAIRFWNAIRMLRIFLITFIWDIITRESELGVLKIPETAASKYDYLAYLKEYATKHIDEITNGVLASVPGYLESEASSHRFRPPSRSLIWPLTLLHVCPLCPTQARDFALFCLKKLAADLNMPQAVFPTQNLGSNEDWLHLYHLT